MNEPAGMERAWSGLSVASGAQIPPTGPSSLSSGDRILLDKLGPE